MKLKNLLFCLLISILILPLPVLADENSDDLLNVAQELWQKISNKKFEYGGASTIPPSNKVDSSAYVSWVLYELGFDKFTTQQTTVNFINTDWNALYGWEEIKVNENEDVTTKLQPGDILVRDTGSGGSAGHINITVEVIDGKVMVYDAGSASNWKDSAGKAIEKTEFAKNDSRAGKIIRIKNIKKASTAPNYPQCNNKGNFPIYELNDEQLQKITSLAKYYSKSLEAISHTVSFMANLYEIRGSKYGQGADGLYNYIFNGGWFNSKSINDTASQEEINAVKFVLVNGKRTLPNYIDEGDLIDDIDNIKNTLTFMTKYNLNNLNNYIPFETIITNNYGSKYTFYNLSFDQKYVYGYTEASSKLKNDDCYEFTANSIIVDTSENNNTSNPKTSNVSMIILIVGLIGSLALFMFTTKNNYFKKNLG